MESRSINNYIPIEVLKFLSNQTNKAEQHEKPLLDFIKTPQTTQHNAVVFFADVSGFTNLTEKLSEGINNKNCFYGTDLLAHNLNMYMSLIIGKLTSKGADIIKFAGDSLIAIFPETADDNLVAPKGLPEKKSLPVLGSSTSLLFRKRRKRLGSASDSVIGQNGVSPSSAIAVWIAVLIQSGGLLTNFSVHLDAPTQPVAIGQNVTPQMLKKLQNEIEMKVKIGISKGEIIMAHIGGAGDKVMKRRVEYVAIGEALQQAFACEGECGPGDIYITPEVYQEAYSFFKKGKVDTKLLQKKTRNISFTKKNNLYKVVGTSALDEPMIFHTPRQLFDNIADPVLWSYVPLTARPYLMSNNSKNEIWVNEFRKVTTIFCQLGFDKSITDGMAHNSEEDLLEFNRIFSEVQHYVYLYEGQINKFLIDDKGNTLIIVFGLCPFAHDNDEARAVNCARAIIEVCKKNKLWTAIGISTGMVYCGLFGSMKRKEYTVLGDSVNVAARLMTQVIYDGLSSKPKPSTRKTKKKAVKLKSNQMTFNDPIPMYIDLPTRQALTKILIPTQFLERSEKVKVKGKSLELRLFYASNLATKRQLAYSNLKNRGIYCENRQGQSLNYKVIPGNTQFKNVRKIFSLDKGLQLLWCKNPVTDLKTGVHPDETLAQMSAEVNNPSFLQFVTVHQTHFLLQKPRRLLKNKDFVKDLATVPRPSEWPFSIREVVNEKGAKVLSIQEEVSKEAFSTNWYECLDSFEIIEKLRCFENNLFNGLQVICLESGYGIGKNYAVNHVFLDDTAPEKKKYVTLNVKSTLTELESNQSYPFKEIFKAVELLCEHLKTIKKFKNTDKTKLIAQAFNLGKVLYEKNVEDTGPGSMVNNDEPVKSDLWLLNSVLGTKFSTRDSKIDTLLNSSSKHKKRLIRCSKDMMKIFNFDDVLHVVAENVDDPRAISKRLSVERLCSVLCCILAGFTKILKQPIVTIISSANSMCSFSWYLLTQLCSHWKNTDLTFIVTLRVLSSLESLYEKSKGGYIDEFQVNFPIETNELTTSLLKYTKSAVTGEFEVTHSKKAQMEKRIRNRYSVRQVLVSSTYNNVDKARSIEELPYPIAKEDLHNEFLQIRLRAYSHSHFIEVRARKEYTEKIAKNVLEVKKIDPILVKLLESRTNGNATYVKESLDYYMNKKILTIDSIPEEEGEFIAKFDHEKFENEYFQDVPIMIESYCSMIFDQVEGVAQTLMKIAAYRVSIKPPAEQYFTLEDIIALLPFRYAEYMTQAQAAFSSLMNSNIFEEFSPGAKDNNMFKIPYRFSEDWLRICVLRKLTNQQRSKFVEKSL